MANDTTLASIWTEADVFLAKSLTTANPADASTAFSVDWTMVGLLDGKDGFEESRDVDKKEHPAWGGTIVRITRRNFVFKRKFSVLEDNVTTRSLIWPGSSATERIVPVVANVKMAFEVREGGKVKRYITRYYAQVDVDGAIQEGEDDLTKVSLEATVFPDANGVLFDVQTVPDIASIAITPLTLELAVAGIGALVATATYSDDTTGVVTSSATWSTSAAAKATVVGGYVTGVAAGTSNISCSLGGVTSTAPSVATVS